ncbi:autotransporter outer membrane beta-barrel domain-containing protein, partial [Parasphingorhabdus sp.]|uniref:beta strand repeat-containing protein n=1 Tax=Parasphingorhabdus sp. TaxID=2709688 RepID=UPI0032644D74
HGIHVNQSASGTGDLTIEAVNASGGKHGILADNYGSGALSITATGTVAGRVTVGGTNHYNGIDADNSSAGTDLTINAADTTGGNAGIYADHDGSGALSITSTGTATGTDFAGIFANNSSAGTGLTINAAATTGGDEGIAARNYGSGALSITSTGTATGTDDDGIDAYNSSAGTDLIINAAGTTGGYGGIEARNFGSGALSITATGAATGTDFNGIYAFNSSAGTDLTINAAETTGGGRGIYVRNYGSGVLSITAAGTATGTSGSGISARNNSAGTDLTINAVDTTGGRYGILALNEGSGALSVSSTGTVTGTSDDGLYAKNSSSGTDLIIEAADTTGGQRGIIAQNNGSGEISVVSTGTTTGSAYSAITVTNSSAGTDLTIEAFDTQGKNAGIFGYNSGSGAVSITSTGVAAGTNFTGIAVTNKSAGTDLTIAAADATGGIVGIYARNEGAGGLSISSTGTVTGTSDYGIDAGNNINGTDLTINAADTSGGIDGIHALNEGSGALSITSTGAVTGTTGDGINADNSANGTSLSIAVEGTVVGADNGIDASNNGTGGLTITIDGDVTGETGEAVNAFNSVNDVTASTLISQTAGTTTTGATNGMAADNAGGSLTINALGTTVGLAGFGIDALNQATATDLTITANDVTGSVDGIHALNEGSGVLSITATGTITGTSNDGINAYNSANGTSLSITVEGTVVGADNGIDASNYGTGGLNINIDGDVTGETGEAVNAFNSANDVTASTVIEQAAGTTATGAINGITVNNAGGSLTINALGTTVGLAGSGIDAVNEATATGVTINANNVNGVVDGISVTNNGSVGTTINSTGVVEAGTGVAVNAMGAATTLNNSGTINGGISLSDLDDTVNNSGVFNVTQDSDFGAGTDQFINTGTINAISGQASFTNLGSLINNGAIILADGTVGDMLTISGDYSGSGAVLLDITDSGADRLIIVGALTGTREISANYGGAGVPEIGSSILLVDAGAGTSADAVTLVGASSGFTAYGIVFDAQNNDFYLNASIGTPAFGLLKFAEGAQSVWYRSADGWAAQMNAQRESGDTGIWGQIYGGKADRKDNFDNEQSTFEQAVSLDYRQNYTGFQLGYDFELGIDGTVMGLTTGYIESRLSFVANADRVDYEAYNIGAYAGIQFGGFFGNLLVKYDFVDLIVDGATTGYETEFDAESYGGRLEAGYRLETGEHFVEPIVSIEYQQTSLDSFSALGANIDFDKFDGLRGMAGLRVGGETDVAKGSSLKYYLSGLAVHEFEGDNGLNIASGSSALRIDNDAHSVFGRLDFGLNLTDKSGVSIFAEGNIDAGKDYDSAGGRVGVRLAF